MVDSTLKDYWTAVRHYRLKGSDAEKRLALSGFVKGKLRSTQSHRSRERLARFIMMEEAAAA